MSGSLLASPGRMPLISSITILGRASLWAGLILFAFGLALPGSDSAYARTAKPSLRLVTPVDGAALAATRLATQRLQGVQIDGSQSYRISERGRVLGSLVSGLGQGAGATYMGCFVALVQDGATQVVPTIGHGNWEAQTCGGVAAMGIVALRDDIVLIGIVYEASSPNAHGREPVIIRWSRKDRTMLPDEELSQLASESNGQTISAMRRLLR